MMHVLNENFGEPRHRGRPAKASLAAFPEAQG